MTDTTPTGDTSTPAAPAADDPLALYGADAVSGARFLRWNLAAAIVGILALGLGFGFAPAAATTQAQPFQLRRVARDVEVVVPAGSFRCDHLVLESGDAQWEYWLAPGDRPTLVKWRRGDDTAELAAPPR